MNRMKGRFVPRALLFCSALVIGLAVFAVGVDATDRDRDRSRSLSSQHGYDKRPHHDRHHDWDDDDDRECSSFNKCGGMGSISGAIYTTDENASVVNGNLYDAATDVYLGGGPTVARSNTGNKKTDSIDNKINSNKMNGKTDKNRKSDGRDIPKSGKPQPAGLPDGSYYFQVTNPSGKKLLSLDPIEERRFEVAGGYIQDLSGSHNFNAPGDPFPPNYLVIQLSPFLPTDNKGGEYKVWVTPVKAYAPGKGVFGFQEECSKTDNFKLRSFGGGGIFAFITGAVFADDNLNGAWDKTGTSPEPGEPNVQMNLYIKGGTAVTAFTFPSATGQWSFQVNPASVPVTYLVVPQLQNSGQAFAPTLPPVREVTISSSGLVVDNQLFGVVEIGDSGSNIRFPPAYWAEADPGTPSQGEKVLTAYGEQVYDVNNPPAFLNAALLQQCPSGSSLTTIAEVQAFLQANPYESSSTTCKMATLWLGLNLAIATNGVTADLDPGTPGDERVTSITGAEKIYLGLDPVTDQPVYSSLAELLAQVAAGYAGFGPLYEPFYLSALYQASENLNFVQSPSGGGGPL